MSKGPRLTEDEIEEARKMRVQDGLRWRDIGLLLHRDHSGLCRATGNPKPSRGAVLLSRRLTRALAAE